MYRKNNIKQFFPLPQSLTNAKGITNILCLGPDDFQDDAYTRTLLSLLLLVFVNDNRTLTGKNYI